MLHTSARARFQEAWLRHSAADRRWQWTIRPEPRLARLHGAGKLHFFGEHAKLVDRAAFNAVLQPLRQINWVVYANEPFAGPKTVLAYLSRYTHRVAISNSRLIWMDDQGITFRVKDYRVTGPGRHTAMTLTTDEFIRRFPLHVLHRDQHRIRHYGPFGNGVRAGSIARIRELLGAETSDQSRTRGDTTDDADAPARVLALPRPRCGGRLIIVETVAPTKTPERRQKQRGPLHDTNITDRNSHRRPLHGSRPDWHARNPDRHGETAVDSRGARRMLIKTIEACSAAARSRSFDPTCRDEPKAMNRFKSP